MDVESKNVQMRAHALATEQTSQCRRSIRERTTEQGPSGSDTRGASLQKHTPFSDNTTKTILQFRRPKYVTRSISRQCLHQAPSTLPLERFSGRPERTTFHIEPRITTDGNLDEVPAQPSVVQTSPRSLRKTSRGKKCGCRSHPGR